MVKHRWIPLTWGLIDVAIAAALLRYWHVREWSLLYWVRGVVFGFFAYNAYASFALAAFGKAYRVERAVKGDFQFPPWRGEGLE